MLVALAGLDWADWEALEGRPRAQPSTSGSKVLLNFWGFNKCVFTNVFLGENNFLLFLCVASLGLAVEVQPIL